MYTKGTQTVPSRSEEIGTSTDSVEHTPHKQGNAQHREFGSAAKRLEFQQQEREEEEAKQAVEEAKEVIEEVEEHKSQVIKTELDPEEKRQIIESTDFKDFIFKSARIVERALLLEENYNILKDYTRAASTSQYVLVTRFFRILLITRTSSGKQMKSTTLHYN
jgi:ATP-dependent 26S proteasome regulatory subunit